MTIGPGGRIGSYEIGSCLGTGGMGRVYRARDTKLERDVALKFVVGSPASGDERASRVLAEARAAAALNHPGIATIYEVADTYDPPFIVMELVDGESLRATVERVRSLEPKVVTKIAVEIADALAAAHALHFVHGDVKPENLIRQPDGRVKLLDFGIARLESSEPVTAARTAAAVPATPEANLAGTLAYMPPEAIRGEPIDARADLYSLGVVCHELLTGRRPFLGPTAGVLMKQILDEPAPPLDASVPAPLRRLVGKLLEKPVAARYQSAVDVRVDATNVLRDLELGATLSARIAGRRSVAVLPFRLITPSSADEHLSVALADAVITDLGARARVLVRPTSAVMRFGRDTDPLVAGRELSVDVVVDGSLQKQADRIRVHVQVRQVADGTTLESKKLEGRTSDLFELQDRLAATVGRSLGGDEHAAAEPPTSHAGAYDLYLRAMDRLSRPNQWDTRTAIEMLKRVTRLDPGFAAAWASLAGACLHMGNTFEPKLQWHRQAERAMERALALDPGNTEAHAARGRVLWSQPKGFQHRPALKAFAVALRLNPQSRQALTWRGLVLTHVGLHEQALDHLTEALASGPDDPLVIQFIGQALWFQGRYEAALDQNERALSIDPVHLWSNIFHPGIALYAGDLNRADRAIDAGRQVIGQEALLTASEALLWAKRGEITRAEQAIVQALNREKSFLHEHHTLHTAALVYALLGQPSEAVRHLRAAVDTGFPNYRLFRDDPHLESLRSDPLYRALLADLRQEHEAYSSEFGSSRP